MKKMTLSQVKGKMSKAEMKKVMGGSGGGVCWRCDDVRGYSSCWYTTNPWTLCQRVYPGSAGISYQVGCSGCHM